MNAKKTAVVLAHALVLQALCWVTIGISFAMTTEANALIIHAIGAPIIAAAVSLVYFERFNYTTPLQTAAIFTGVVVALDFFIVAMLIQRSFAMFASPIGTWIPMTLIFSATYLVGLYTNRGDETVGIA